MNINHIYLKKTHILLYLIIGVFLLAQSRFFNQTAGYGTFNILDLRSFIGASTLQLFLLISTTVLLFFHFKRVRTRQNKKMWWLLIIMLYVAFVSMVFYTKIKGAGVRTIIDYSSAIIYFVIFSSFKWDKKHIQYFMKLLKYFFILNLVVGFFQWLFLGYMVDHLQGLVDDAHMFAFLMYIATFFVITKYWMFKTIQYLVYAIPPILLALVASNDKVTIFFIISFLILYVIYKRVSFKNILIASLTIIFISTSAFYLYNKLSTKYQSIFSSGLGRFKNLETTLNFAYNSPRSVAYRSIPEIYYNKPSSILIGVGPTRFGSEEVDMSSKYARIAFPIGMEALLGSKVMGFGTSFFLVILIEFGLLFTVIFIYFLKKTLQSVSNFRSVEFDKEIRHILLWLYGYLIMVVLISFIVRGGGLAGSTNVIPFFALMGMLNSYIRFNNKEVKRNFGKIRDSVIK